MELNREELKNELDTQLEFAKFTKSNGVLISAKCAQFCLEHIQYYEQKIKELTEENERLEKALVEQSAENVMLIGENKRLMRDKTALECVVSTVRNQAKADTVRKMQERLHEQFHDRVAYTRSYVHDTIDQIAKEMLDDEMA